VTRVIANLTGVPPGVLEVVHRRAHGRPTQAAQRGRQLVPEAGLARRGQAVNTHPEPTRAQPRDPGGTSPITAVRSADTDGGSGCRQMDTDSNVCMSRLYELLTRQDRQLPDDRGAA
jgi:hypothetical protein